LVKAVEEEESLLFHSSNHNHLMFVLWPVNWYNPEPPGPILRWAEKFPERGIASFEADTVEVKGIKDRAVAGAICIGRVRLGIEIEESSLGSVESNIVQTAGWRAETIEIGDANLYGGAATESDYNTRNLQFGDGKGGIVIS
jgi:hypothetical protein